MPLSVPPCTHPAVPISIVGTPATYRWSRRPYATFKIAVDASGHVTGATLEDGTGNSATDAAAADAVRRWTFMPASQACKAVAGEVEYAVPVGENAFTYPDPCNHDAEVGVQFTPQYPDAAIGTYSGPVAVSVKVIVDGAGRVMDYKVVQPSADAAFNAAAASAALHSTYHPAVYDCRAADGAYLFRVTFHSD